MTSTLLRTQERIEVFAVTTAAGVGRQWRSPIKLHLALEDPAGLSTSMVVICMVVICSSVTPRTLSAGSTSLWMCR
jgi:hypothetical protein